MFCVLSHVTPVPRVWRRNKIATKTYTRMRNCMHQTELFARQRCLSTSDRTYPRIDIDIILIYFAGSETSLRGYECSSEYMNFTATHRCHLLTFKGYVVYHLIDA